MTGARDQACSQEVDDSSALVSTRPHRRSGGIGISTRVVAGLAVIVATMLTASLIIGFTFGNVSESIRSIAIRDIPSLIQTLSLVRESERMRGITPDLIAAQNPFIRESLTREFRQDVLRWEKLVGSISERNGDSPHVGNLIGYARVLHENIGTISDIIDERMKIADRIILIDRRIRRLGERLNRELSAFEGMDWESDRRHQMLMQAINRASILLLVVNIATSPEELERVEGRFHEACIEMERRLREMPENLQLRYSPIREEYLRFGRGEESLFALAARDLDLANRIEDQLIANQFISDRIRDSTNNVLEDIKFRIDSESEHLVGELTQANHLAKVLPVVSVVCSVLIILYLRRSVIARILRLKRTMIDHVKGSSSLIEVKGNDEITAMAEATNFFINEIKKRELRLRESEIKYRNLFEMAPVAIYRVDIHTGEVRDSNRAASAAFGYDYKDTFYGSYSHATCFADSDQAREFGMRIAENGRVDGFEMLTRRADGSPLHLVISAVAYPDGGYLECAAIDMTEILQARETLRRSHEELERIVRDRTREVIRQNELLHQEIAERSAAEAALRESEERFRLLAENLKEVLCLVEMDSNVLSYANPAFGKLFGMHADAFRRNPSLLAERIHPADREAIRTLLNSQWGTEKLENQAMEYRLTMPDGERKWVLSRVMYIRDASGNIARAAIMAEDITERKHAEKLIRDSARRLKYLSTKLLEAQEEERRNLAAELHDNIGPDLGTVKFGVENVINGLGNDCQDQKEVLQTVIGIVKKVVRLIGRLQMELRPSIIDDLGVIEALDWYCQDYLKVYRHVAVEKHIRTSENLIPERLKIVIYRIVQEAFNNVTKHSGANRISLCLESEADILTLVIEDNGQGFDPSANGNLKRRDSGLGLVSMRERTELSAGSFNITSLPGSGTRIECQWDCEMVQGLEDNPA